MLSLIAHETAIEEMIRTMNDVCWVEITHYVPITDNFTANEVKVLFRLRPFVTDFAQQWIAPEPFQPFVHAFQRQLTSDDEDARKKFLRRWSTKAMGTMDATYELQAILDSTQPFDPKVDKAVIRIHKDDKMDGPYLPLKIMLPTALATAFTSLVCLCFCVRLLDPKSIWPADHHQRCTPQQ